MEFVDKVRKNPLFQKIEKFFPAIAFLGGFGWDSITLGRVVKGTDLLFLLAYYTGALVMVILLAKAPSLIETESETDKTSSNEETPAQATNVLSRNSIKINRISWALQFCFGSLFSALVVCYFKSSGSLASLILVLLLAGLLVGNEFLKKHYESFGVSLAFFCLLGTMFLNFTIPHIVHRIGFLPFFFSTLISFGICLIIWKISHKSKQNLIAPIAISVLLIFVYLMNWVPPVPLVLKQHIVCQNFDRTTYSCDIDEPSTLQKLGLSSPTVHKIPGNEVYYLSSVYAPTALKAPIEYRWYYEDPKTGKYRLTDKITSSRMTVKGGREDGYRSYSKKKNVPPGMYRVETAYKNGAVIGSSTFEVFEGAPKEGFIKETLR